MSNLNTAETIAEITNLKTLQIYRTREGTFARSVDDILAELSEDIIDALDPVPAEEIVAVKLDKENNREASTGPDAEPKDESQAPTSGGGLDTKQEEPEISELGQKLADWMKENALTPYKAGPIIGITGQSVSNLITGTTMSATVKTKKKILAAIKKTKPSEPKPEKKPASTPLRAAPKGPVQFVHLKLATWMSKERLGNSDAAARLGVAEKSIRSIQNGIMPHSNVLRHLGASIPEISANLGSLLSENKKNNNG